MGFHWEGMRAVPKLYLAFFTVVASRPNLSTFVFTAAKLRRKKEKMMCLPHLFRFLLGLKRGFNYFWAKMSTSCKLNLKSATIIQYTIKGRFMSR